ncbi:sugar kinase [Alteromonas gilva]|uniref:Sugar kinase n=1 Tax=Alteromonas gilva TaxID=2987522 RepID=A0ABT5KWV8_9ALTE|nr:sugar kinase [Alteromonas gilva]MDC8829263.1 sugar kinase [Alteromonas gilva]
MPTCLIIGECMVELAPLTHDSLRKQFAGDTFNTAVYLKRCLPTCEVNYFTAVGTDLLSREMTERFAEEGINTQYVARSQSKTVGMYLVNTDASGERSFSYWRNDSAARQMLTTAALPDVYFDIVYVSGITVAILDEPQREILISGLKRYQQAGAKIVFDPNYRPQLWSGIEQAREWTKRLYSLCDIAFPGGDDHRELYGHQSEQEVFTFLQGLGVREIVLKRGAESVEIAQHNAHFSVAVKPVAEVVDTTSAGDAFIGGYLAKTLAGEDCCVAAGFGARVAGIVIGAKGAIIERDYFFQRLN